MTPSLALTAQARQTPWSIPMRRATSSIKLSAKSELGLKDYAKRVWANAKKWALGRGDGRATSGPPTVVSYVEQYLVARTWRGRPASCSR